MKRPFSQSISLQGDALAQLKKFPNHCFDLCIADPPYNMSRKKGLSWAFSKHVTMQENWDRFTPDHYIEFTLSWLKEVCRVVKPNGNLLIFGTYHNIYTQGFLLQQLDRRILNSIIWVKPNAQPNITCRMLTESTEQIIWACNESTKKATKWVFNYELSKKLNDNKQMRNAWSIPVTRKAERVANHPTQKPRILLDRLIQLCSRKGQWILDPFAGVGTTGVSALALGRKCCLIEKEPRYFQAQQRRFKDEGLGRDLKFLKRWPNKTMNKTPAELSL